MGSVEVEAPELVAEGGEEQRGGLAGDAGEGEHAAGDDAGRRGAQGDGEDGAPLGDAQAEGGFADGVGHGGEHLFGGAGDGGDHHDGERDAAGEGGEVLLLHDDQG